MIQVVDYQNELYGISQTQEWGGNTLNLKIGEVEFTLPLKTELTITEIPKEIFQKKVISPEVTGYVDKFGNSIRVDEFKGALTEFNKLKVWDDDAEESIWETKEDKLKYESFLSNWKPVYSEQKIEWIPVEFEVVIKQHVPDKYKSFITSSIILETRTIEGNSFNKCKKAICSYFTNATTMIRMVANELGFTIVENEHKTEGKNIFIYKSSDVLRFSKVNGNYFRIGEEVWKKYRNVTGTLEQCITQYEWEYKQIYNYLLGVRNTIENKIINPEERKELLELMDKAAIQYNKVDSMKSTRTYYNELGRTLNLIKKKLSMLPDE